MAQPFNILSREYDYTEVVCDDGTGPTYSERDWCIVMAENARDARGKGVRALRKLKSPIFDDGENPFKGLKVEAVIAYPPTTDEDGSVYEGSTIEDQIEGAKQCRCFFDFTASDRARAIDLWQKEAQG